MINTTEGERAKMLADGYTFAPPGKLVAAVTYLELRPGTMVPPAPTLDLQRLRGKDVARYRALYRAVGENWLWESRLTMPVNALAAILDDDRVEALALRLEGRDVGLLELDFRPESEAELAYFGLTSDVIGKGLGRALMDEAKARAFTRPIRRLFVHTCHFDHPDALAFYQRSGFVPYARAVEVFDDPRLKGALPRTAGRHVPLIG